MNDSVFKSAPIFLGHPVLPKCDPLFRSFVQKSTVKIKKTTERTEKKTEKKYNRKFEAASISDEAECEKVEKKTKRKIERSPKRVKKKAVAMRVPASSSSVCSSASEVRIQCIISCI